MTTFSVGGLVLPISFLWQGPINTELKAPKNTSEGVLIGSALLINPGGEKGKKQDSAKLNCDAVPKEASADSTGNPEGRMSLRSYAELGQRGWAFSHPCQSVTGFKQTGKYDLG